MDLDDELNNVDHFRRVTMHKLWIYHISTPSGGPFQASRKGVLGDVGFWRAGGLLPLYEYGTRICSTRTCTRMSAVILNDRYDCLTSTGADAPLRNW